MKRHDIVIMKKRGVVIMDKSEYIENYLTLPSTKQFQKLNLDLTKSIEEKVQRMVKKIKSKLTNQEYKRVYLSSSCLGKFYSTAKLQKIDSKGLVDDLLDL